MAGQVCLAYRNDGGRVCVVLSPVEKLEMEARLNELIPPASRFGTTFVVRQVRLLATLRIIHLRTSKPSQKTFICFARDSLLHFVERRGIDHAIALSLQCGSERAPHGARP